MGGSSWSDDHYRDRAAHRVATHAPTFAHDTAVRTGTATTTIHASLDPRKITPEMRGDIARAIIDRAWPRVRGCEVYVTVTMERAKNAEGKIVAVPCTHLTAALFYSESRAR